MVVFFGACKFELEPRSFCQICSGGIHVCVPNISCLDRFKILAEVIVMNKYYLAGLIVAIVFLSCNSTNRHIISDSSDAEEHLRIYSLSEEIEKNGGVVITVDDKGISNWYSNRKYFINKNVKCTFFITRIQDLTNDEINMLIELEGHGHELAYHGTNHINADEFLRLHSLQEYFDYEISPGLSIMESKLTPPTAFAYPFGARNDSLDEYLSNHFEILRGTAYTSAEHRIENLEAVFVNTNETNSLVHGVGIDSIYNNSSNDIQRGLDRANNNGEIIIFYLHNFGGSDMYHMNFSCFDEMIHCINDLNMPIITISQINTTLD